MPIQLRAVATSDAPAVGRVLVDAFGGIARQHIFPPDFPSVDIAIHFAGIFIDHPRIFGIVAEEDGRVIGSNFLDERDEIRSVGPISVDPSFQSRGIGRKLMQAAVDRGRGAAGIRLVQDAFNTTSMSLYTSLGFDVKEPLALMQGRPKDPPPARANVRPMRQQDLPACEDLCRRIHGLGRSGELADALRMFNPMVLERGGQILAYASAPPFWPMNHGVAETTQDMCDLLLGASAATNQPLALLLPTRESDLFRWCLGQGLRVIKPLSLMAMGRYQEPRGCWYPSVGY